MYEKIEQILGRPLGGGEVQKLNQLVSKYSEEEIINAYDYCEVKKINYIATYLENHKETKPSWFEKEIKDEKVSKQELIDFIKDWKAFFIDEEEWKKWAQQQMDDWNNS